MKRRTLFRAGAVLAGAGLGFAVHGTAGAAITNGPQKVADINGDVTTMCALPGGLLAIGGLFTRVSGQPVSNLAVINPLTGAVVYRGSLDGVPWATAYLNGRLYVGGTFSQRALAFNVSNWTRSSWNPQAGVAVKALSARAGRVFVATSSRLWTTDPATGAHRTEARAVSNSGGPTGPIRSLHAAPDGRLYVGGQFDSIVDDQGHGQHRPGLQALDQATGSIDFTFQPVLRPNPINFEGDVPLAIRYDSVLGRVVAGLGSGNGNHLRSFHRDGSLAEIDMLTTGDCQTCEVIVHGTGATSYFGGWHNQHSNEPTRFFGAEADPRTGTWSTWNPRLSGVMPNSAGNDGVESSAIVGNWLIAGGSFTSPFAGLARYQIT